MRRFLLCTLFYSFWAVVPSIAQKFDNNATVKMFIPADGCISCVSTLIECCRRLELYSFRNTIYVVAERPIEARKRIALFAKKGFDVKYYPADSVSSIDPTTYPWVIALHKKDTIYIGTSENAIPAIIYRLKRKSNRL